MGYVGFSVAFAFAIASLMAGRLDTAWVPASHGIKDAFSTGSQNHQPPQPSS
jgi:cytochrome c biogenesis factor